MRAGLPLLVSIATILVCIGTVAWQLQAGREAESRAQQAEIYADVLAAVTAQEVHRQMALAIWGDAQADEAAFSYYDLDATPDLVCP